MRTGLQGSPRIFSESTPFFGRRAWLARPSRHCRGSFRARARSFHHVPGSREPGTDFKMQPGCQRATEQSKPEVPSRGRLLCLSSFEDAASRQGQRTRGRRQGIAPTTESKPSPPPNPRATTGHRPYNVIEAVTVTESEGDDRASPLQRNRSRHRHRIRGRRQGIAPTAESKPSPNPRATTGHRPYNGIEAVTVTESEGDDRASPLPKHSSTQATSATGTCVPSPFEPNFARGADWELGVRAWGVGVG